MMMQFDWTPILIRLKNEMLQGIQPVVAGFLPPGFDLDVVVVAERSCSGASPALDLLKRIGLAARAPEVALFTTLRQLSTVAPEPLDRAWGGGYGLLHVHLFADFEDALASENHWILAGLLGPANYWVGSTEATSLLQRTIPEPIEQRLGWYRSVLREGIQVLALQIPSPPRAIFDALYRLRLVSKHCLREVTKATSHRNLPRLKMTLEQVGNYVNENAIGHLKSSSSPVELLEQYVQLDDTLASYIGEST